MLNLFLELMPKRKVCRISMGCAERRPWIGILPRSKCHGKRVNTACPQCVRTVSTRCRCTLLSLPPPSLSSSTVSPHRRLVFDIHGLGASITTFVTALFLISSSRPTAIWIRLPSIDALRRSCSTCLYGLYSSQA